MLALLLAIQETDGKKLVESFLPTSVVGWLTTIGLILSVAERIWNRGKKQGVSEETVNGMGLRVKAVEEKNKMLEGRFEEHQRSVDRILVQNEHLIKELGKAERGTDQCREDTERFTIEIGSKVDSMRRDVMAELSTSRREFGERAGALEVAVGVLTREVQLRAEFEEREDRNQRGQS